MSHDVPDWPTRYLAQPVESIIVMRQEADPARVLDYAAKRARFRFRVHVPTAIAATIVVLALNVWPHFVATVKNAADIPEPELGWPWVFFFYGQTYGGYGPWWVPERILYDAIWAVLIILGARYAACRITTRCNGPAGRNGPCDSNAARCPAGH